MFQVIAALLSRSKVFVVEPLDEVSIVMILRRALTDDEHGLGRDAGGRSRGAGARRAVRQRRRARGAESAAAAVPSAPRTAGRPRIDSRRSRRRSRAGAVYDKSGEEHFNIISALHKSMRNSDPDASLYWLARMLEAGEDPMYIARRLVRFASEDIGNADPQARSLSVAAKDAVHFLGMPEGDTALAEAVIYLATAPKSNAVYGYSAAAEAARRTSPRRCRCTCATRRRNP